MVVMRLCYASCAALANSLTKKAPYKGLGADSEEKREPVSDIDTAVVDSLKALDPQRPIREADIAVAYSITLSAAFNRPNGTVSPSALAALRLITRSIVRP
jgi:hypothetical protein